MEEWMWTVWLGVFIVALIIETLGPEIVSIWFAGGALIALIVSFIPGVAWWTEAVVFAVVSLGLLLFLRPIITKMIKRETVPSNVDEMSGKKGIVTQDIEPLNPGEVTIDNVIWTAIASKDGDTIKKGTKVKVVAISGNKVIVIPLN